MADLIFWHKRAYRFTPVSYSVDETRNVFTVKAGEVVGPVFVVNEVAFDGTGGRTFKFGDSGANGRFSDTSDTDITAAAGTIAEGVGAAGRYANVGRYMYTSDTTLNIYFTAATGGSPTVGRFCLYVYTARLLPN